MDSIKDVGSSDINANFMIHEHYTSEKDFFCIREKRTVNGYQRISLFNHNKRVNSVAQRYDIILSGKFINLINLPSFELIKLLFWNCFQIYLP